MNLFLRSNVKSSLRILFSKQPVLLLSQMKHSTKPLCNVCLHQQFPQLSSTTVQQRHQHTKSFSALDNLSKWQRIKWNMGFHGKLQVTDDNLSQASYNLYVCCTDFIDFSQFTEALNLPDTFISWFRLLQLHLWLVNVKVSQMGLEGVLLKELLYKSMWVNVEKRMKTFKDLTGKERNDALQKYHTLMIMSILYYDEGLIGSDKLLANSLWVQLFALSPDVEADKLELMVKYVRKQVHHIDHLDTQSIMYPGYISFLPLHKDRLDRKKAQHDLKSLTDIFVQ